MTRVRKLEIEEVERNSDVKKMLASLAELENLDYLVLKGFRFRSMPSLDGLGVLHSLTRLKLGGLLTRLPDAHNFPPNISHLTLFNTCLAEDPMLVLEKLPKLTYLKLRNAYTGEKMVISDNGLPEIQFLLVGELWHLKDVQVGEDAVPKLKGLEINHCPYLERLPQEMITHLSELKMLTTKTIATYIQDKSLNSKIRHVHIQP